MTLEDKNILLKDLCARLPYKVKLGFENSDLILVPTDFNIYTMQLSTNQIYPKVDRAVIGHIYDVWDYRPYLRPMSSMTEEERDELELLCDGLDIDDEGNSSYYMSIIKNHKSNTINFKIIDFLISRHFDYRGLIEKGLALEAPEGMYKID